MSELSSHRITTKAPAKLLRSLAGITLLFLASEFLVGMVVNLYVQIPSAHPGAGAADFFLGVVQGVVWALGHATWALVLHVTLGLLLALASLLLIGFSIAARRRAWIILSITGWIGVFGAGFNGASFLNYGHDFSSLLMSVGFLVAAISYTIGFSLRS